MSATQTQAPTQTNSNPKQKPPQKDKRLKVLDVTMKRNHYRQDSLIEVLHKAQESFGYLELEILEYIAKELKLPLSRVYGVATFYHLFSLKPGGEHNCVVCMGTACYVKGGDKIIEQIEQDLNVKVGETTEDGKVSLLSARCIGACGIAPAVVLDGTVQGKQTPESTVAKLKKLQSE
ncbi:bidirectional hydrogenase complex protein HoxE [Spirulina sp. CS-785/01]|uniref:bidirectional hydrogenase complex protein HoxE n=1 Tax=Spirulina sp. CS-785/01 TaxID=3021716 RepID=UPI00232ECBED|nr:bidirectional hydrogenase complex protein HoxE [Spirulina sp. CS-785/01]MDB9312166.1 bidirectional hydrogenase complex protein HoxE [Spirulina sp. CS-785/01]